MLSKDQKIESYKNDISKLNDMIQILDSTDRLNGAMYGEISSAINSSKEELERMYVMMLNRNNRR